MQCANQKTRQVLKTTPYIVSHLGKSTLSLLVEPKGGTIIGKLRCVISQSQLDSDEANSLTSSLFDVWCVISKSQSDSFGFNSLTSSLCDVWCVMCDMRLLYRNSRTTRVDSLATYFWLLWSTNYGANGSQPPSTSPFTEDSAMSFSLATYISQTWTMTFSNFFIWAQIWVSFALLELGWRALRSDANFIKILPPWVLSLFTIWLVLFRDPLGSILLDPPRSILLDPPRSLHSHFEALNDVFFYRKWVLVESCSPQICFFNEVSYASNGDRMLKLRPQEFDVPTYHDGAYRHLALQFPVLGFWTFMVFHCFSIIKRPLILIAT